MYSFCDFLYISYPICIISIHISNVSLINRFGCVHSRHFRIREARIVAQTFSLWHIWRKLKVYATFIKLTLLVDCQFLQNST